MLKIMRSSGRVALATAGILLIPLLAMQFTDEVAWSAFDFAFLGVFLFGAGLTYELVARGIGDAAYRYAVAIALVGALLLVLVNAAVGIIGSDDNGANAMYLGVLAVAVVGTITARFHPDGMARALFATALAQALVAVIALIGGAIDPAFWGEATSHRRTYQAFQIAGVNAMFIALFLTSAWLFRTSGRGRSPAGAQPHS